MTKAWEGYVPIPVKGRSVKPRTSGYTMVIEKGSGINATKDLMNTAADYIDSVKNTFGTAAFLDEKLLKEKIEIIKAAGVDVYPGGTFLEAYIVRELIRVFINNGVPDGDIFRVAAVPAVANALVAENILAKVPLP